MVRLFDRYLDDIGREPLLSREEETRLARLARGGDRAARHRLVSANLRFVVSIARHYQGRGLPIADLVNEGNLGLLKAVERFDASRGVRFVSYAHWWVRRAIVEALRRESGLPTGDGKIARPVSLDEPLGVRGANTLQEVLADDRHPPPERRLLRLALRQSLEASLVDVPERERSVLRRYFGLDAERPESLDSIARDLGITRERARQLKERGLARLRAQARRHDLSAFRASAGTE